MGVFKTEEEKKDFLDKKILLNSFVLLGNIFTVYHELLFQDPTSIENLHNYNISGIFITIMTYI